MSAPIVTTTRIKVAVHWPEGGYGGYRIARDMAHALELAAQDLRAGYGPPRMCRVHIIQETRTVTEVVE